MIRLDPKYFVWRFDDNEPYRVYGSKKYYLPKEDDSRCVWRGDSLSEAREVAKMENKSDQQKTIARKVEVTIYDTDERIPDPHTMILADDGQEWHILMHEEDGVAYAWEDGEAVDKARKFTRWAYLSDLDFLQGVV